MLIEASKAGQYDKWGLTDEVLWQANPKLVIAHVSGFGQTGDPAYVSRPSFDPIGQAFSGFAAVNGMPEPEPPYAAKPYTCDYISALFTAWSVAAALINVLRTGKGESIDLAQYETMVRIQSDYLIGGVNEGVQPPRIGIRGNTLQAVPNLQLCKDGKWVMTAFGGIGVMRSLEKLIGLGDDPDFAEPHASVQLRETTRAPKFIAAVEKFFGSHTAEEACRLMDEAGVPCSPVMTYDMMLTKPAVRCPADHHRVVRRAQGRACERLQLHPALQEQSQQNIPRRRRLRRRHRRHPRRPRLQRGRDQKLL